MSPQEIPWEAWKHTVFVCPSRDEPPAEWEQFAILTPDNPMGATVDLQENLRARAWLERELSHRELDYLRVRGASPDHGYWEESYAVRTDESAARELAIEFGQAGYYWIEQGKAELVDVFDPHHRVPLGLLATRWERLTS